MVDLEESGAVLVKGLLGDNGGATRVLVQPPCYVEYLKAK
jgi:hypothetical protein